LPAPQQPNVKQTDPAAQSALLVQTIPVQVGVTQASPPPAMGTHAQLPPPQLNVAQVSEVVHPPETCAEAGVAEPRTIGAT
jgi:hypothetical protein